METTQYGDSQYMQTMAQALRTPAMLGCRQRFSLGPREPLLPDNSAYQLDVLEVFLKQTWTIWGVSTLFGFQPNSELQLKLYGKKLREEVAVILPHEDVTYNAKFTVLEDIKSGPTPADAPAVKIQVSSKSNDRNATERFIYTGIMISWKKGATESNSDRSMKLPLLLCRGTKSAMKAVHAIISHMFDCIVVTLPATDDDLKWLVPVMLNPIDKNEKLDKGEIRMEYRVPGLPLSDSIIVKLEVPALVKMWMAVCDMGDNETETEMNWKVEQVEKFHEVIRTQMLEVAGLQLGLCLLNKISLPSVTIMENRMRATTADAMNRILVFFNEKALEVLHRFDHDSTQTFSSDTMSNT